MNPRMRFGTTLTEKALLALEEAVQECRYGTPRRSFAHRFALAYLWSMSRGDRAPFDALWKALGADKTPWSFSGADTALLVTVGTGVGGAVIAHGEILYGVGGMAGEIGHLVMVPEGPRCTCGNLGCLETLASGPAIVAEAVRRVVQGFTTALTGLNGGDIGRLTAADVARAADEGDEVASDVVDRAGSWLGMALAGAIALLAPEAVVIGGGVAPAGSRYFRAAASTARAHTGVIDINRVAIRPAALGYDAGVIGAARWGSEQAGTVDHAG